MLCDIRAASVVVIFKRVALARVVKNTILVSVSTAHDFS